MTIDDSFTDPVCNSCVGFVKFTVKLEEIEGRQRKAETGVPAGTGTFVKLGRLYGILTAGHVLQSLGTDEVIGLVRFPSIQPVLQNFRLNLGHTERIVLWNGKNGDAPDIALLRIPAVDGKKLEALGALFYNFGLARDFKVSQPEHQMARCYAIVGVVGEWMKESVASAAEGKKVDFGGLFGSAKNLSESEENKTKLVEVHIDYDAGPKVPNSYGGVSGGALWELDVELDKQLKPVKVNKRLHGVAFRQSADRKRITSNASPSIETIIKMMDDRWPNEV